MQPVNPLRPTVVISAGDSAGWCNYFKEFCSFGELLRFFIWRDTIVRYKQALLGAFWVILRPLLNMLLFTLIFGLLARFPSGEVSYPLFVLAGMLPWQMYANCTQDTCNSLVNHGHLISKAYFPRLLLPLSQVCVHWIDTAINLALFLCLAPLLDHFPEVMHLLCFPLVALWTMLLCIGTALWVAPLTAHYRDVRFVVAFFLQFGMFLSPVGYGSFMIPEKWLWLYALNPMVGLIDAYRWSLLDLAPADWLLTFSLSLFTTLVLCASGLLYFRRTEASLADII